MPDLQGAALECSLLLIDAASEIAVGEPGRALRLIDKARRNAARAAGQTEAVFRLVEEPVHQELVDAGWAMLESLSTLRETTPAMRRLRLALEKAEAA